MRALLQELLQLLHRLLVEEERMPQLRAGLGMLKEVLVMRWNRNIDEATRSPTGRHRKLCIWLVDD